MEDKKTEDGLGVSVTENSRIVVVEDTENPDNVGKVIKDWD